MLIQNHWRFRQLAQGVGKITLLILLVTGLTTVLYLQWLKGYFDVPLLMVSVMGTAIAFFIGFINNEAYAGSGRPSLVGSP